MLFAVMLVPLGMAHPAAATAGDRLMAGMAIAEGHCPDGLARHDGKAMPGECTMACASALPALDQPGSIVLDMVATARMEPPAPERMTGILLDIATPPPRNA